MISAIIDIVLMAALAGTIFSQWKTNRKLSNLKSSLRELAPAIEAFTAAIEKSETSVTIMKREVDRFDKFIAKEEDVDTKRKKLLSDVPKGAEIHVGFRGQNTGTKRKFIDNFYNRAKAKVS